MTAPARHSGETPPVDSRKVWRARGPAFRDRFERGRIRITRNFRTKALAVSGG